MTLEDYFKKNFAVGVVDHALRANVDQSGKVTFYLHPAGRDGDTLAFSVVKDVLHLEPWSVFCP